MSFALQRPLSPVLFPAHSHSLCAPFSKTLPHSLSSSSALNGDGVWGFGQKLPSWGIVLLLNGQFYPPLLFTVNEK